MYNGEHVEEVRKSFKEQRPFGRKYGVGKKDFVDGGLW